MADTDEPALRLQVANARAQDSGRGIARLGHAALTQLGLREGDVVEIVGKRHTAAIAVGPYDEDEGLNLVRLDGLQRVKAGTASGDHVEIHPAEIRPATRVTVAPAQKNMRLQGSGEALRRTL
ncbi:MAG: AAA family ATPase, partial [Microvirga sp.]